MAMSANVTDMGVSIAAMIAQIGQIAIVTINTTAQIAIALKQYKLAQKYLDIAEEARDHYESVFAPCEDTEREEVCGTFGRTVALEIENERRFRFSVLKEFKGRVRESIRCLPSWATGATVERILLVEQHKAELSTYGQITGEGAVWSKSEAEAARDYEKLIGVLNRGRDLPAQSIMFAGVAGGILSSFKFDNSFVSYKEPRVAQIPLRPSVAQSQGVYTTQQDSGYNSQFMGPVQPFTGPLQR